MPPDLLTQSWKKLSHQLRRRYVLSPTCQIRGLEEIYLQYFGYRRHGLFVEVGAFDGETASNTSGLADIGWSGHYIEPVPEYAERCRQRHRHNQQVRTHVLAIGESEGTIPIFVGGVLSTADPLMKELFNKLPWARGHHTGQVILARQITLDRFLEEQNVPSRFDLLSIDVEGYEWNVLRGFTLAKWQPQMVIIELHDENPEYAVIRDRCLQIVHYFADHDYHPIYKDLTNTIYIHPDLLKR